MPGATLPNMSIVLPSLGGDSGIWDDEINAALTLVDAHDHTSGKGPRVPTAGINIDADLAYGGFAATGLGKLLFNAVAALSSGSKALFVNSADNELYWRTNGGTNVKLTNGASINTTLVGGIVGDYSSVGAEVAYDDANDRYTFKQQGTKPWARLASGPVRIFEFNTTESVSVELAAPAALAASYSITLPLAAPASTSVVTMDSSGVLAMTRSPTLDNPVVATGGSLTLSGTATLSVNATSAFTGQVNVGTIVASTNYKHSYTKTKIVGPQMVAIGGATPTYDTNAEQITLGTSVLICTYPIPLELGDRLIGWTLYANKTTNNTKTITAQLRKLDATTTTFSSQGGAVTNNANAPGATTLSATGLTIDQTTGVVYNLQVNGSGTTGDFLYQLELQYTRP